MKINTLLMIWVYVKSFLKCVVDRYTVKLVLSLCVCLSLSKGKGGLENGGVDPGSGMKPSHF